MKKTVLASLALGVTAFAAMPAQAADEVVYEPVVTQEEVASAIDIAFGVTFTSRYVSRGVTYTDGPTLQGYVEASYDWAYLGVWASGVDLYDEDGFALSDDVEINLYGGVRQSFGDLTLDVGYVHYFYDDSGSCCGELYGKASYAFTDEFNAGVELYQDLTLDTTYGTVTAALVLPYDFTVSGGVGTFFEDDYNWNAGVSYTFAEAITLDLRYHDSNFAPDRFVASISLDTSLSGLRETFAGGQFGGGR